MYTLFGENITVLGPRQFFDERIMLRFFYTVNSISVLCKESQSWFYIKYSIYTLTLFLLIKGYQLFRNCMFDVTH